MWARAIFTNLTCDGYLPAHNSLAAAFFLHIYTCTRRAHKPYIPYPSWKSLLGRLSKMWQIWGSFWLKLHSTWLHAREQKRSTRARRRRRSRIFPRNGRWVYAHIHTLWKRVPRKVYHVRFYLIAWDGAHRQHTHTTQCCVLLCIFCARSLWCSLIDKVAEK
jgi:hypothetical protein